jgi:hypothetical protein
MFFLSDEEYNLWWKGRFFMLLLFGDFQKPIEFSWKPHPPISEIGLSGLRLSSTGASNPSWSLCRSSTFFPFFWAAICQKLWKKWSK